MINQKRNEQTFFTEGKTRFFTTCVERDGEHSEVVGTYTASRMLQESELQWVRQFLIGLKVSQGDNTMAWWTKGIKAKDMAEAQEACNMVFLAGTIIYIDVREKVAFVRVQTGERGSVPFKCFDKELLKQLERFQKEDFIKIVGQVQNYKNKQTEEYDLSVVLTTIKSPIPVKRESKNGNVPKGYDDLPF